ncbi:MAG: SUMF1/EgtB/PvdO family nonheme iron enzyme [Candidatus Manganitrophus sp.]|nr:MAG: SUMF1/EgtB/PvdO family nonheme iron enzyme [Candidatus Manganitrophus sp.]
MENRFDMKKYFLAPIFVLFSLLFPSHGPSAEEMVQIPAGPFLMGGENSTQPAAPPKKEVTLSPFFIDRVEVTNKAFQNVFPSHAFPPGADNHPVSLVTWEEAKSYCERLDKRLPTEEEWEKAARGTDGRIYPWGNKALRTAAHPSTSGMVKRNAGFNKKDLSPYGALEMASSVWEWTLGAEGEKKIARGGVWNLHLDYEYSTTFDRILVEPDQRFIFLGFRCVK